MKSALSLASKADALVRRSSAELDALIDPKFVYVNAGGMMFDKTTYIDVYCTSGKVIFREQQVSDLLVTWFDEFAIATLIEGIASAVMQTTLGVNGPGTPLMQPSYPVPG